MSHALLLVASLLCGAPAPRPGSSNGRPYNRARGPGPRAPLSAQQAASREINSQIVSATSAEAILRLYDERRDAFDEVNLSTAWNRIGKQYIAAAERRTFFQRNERTLAHMRETTDGIAGRLLPRNLAGVAHGIAKLGYRGAHQTMHHLARTSLACIDDFKPQEIANIMWAFSKASVPSPELFGAVAASAPAKLRDFKPQELSNTAWAFATADTPAPALFAAIADEAIPQLELFKPQELKDLAWAFATLREPAPRLFEHIAREAAPRVHEFNSQELANLAWAFAKADHPVPDLFAALGAEATPRLREFKPQELANTAWAFATAGVANRQLFAAIAREAAPRMGQFKTQELANTVWAFATAGVGVPELFREAERAAIGQMAGFRTQEISNTIWAFATAGVDAPRLFQEASAEVRARPLDFNPQELANVAWAFAKGCPSADGVFEALCDAAQAMLDQISPQGIANMAWAYATANTPSAHRLLSLFEGKIVGGGAQGAASPLADFKAQEVANLVWACATVGAPTERLFAAVADVTPARIVDFEPQDVANTAWAFTVTQRLRPALAFALASRLAGSRPDDLGLEAACQLHQFNMALQLDQPFLPDHPDAMLPAGFQRGDPAPRELSAGLGRSLRQAITVQAPVRSSQFHRHVSAALGRIGVAHVNELCVARAGYHCDIAILPDPAESGDDVSTPGTTGWEMIEPASELASPELAALRSTIIEVNGPFHYTSDGASKPASKTKGRHLLKLGWNVVEVPWWEWDALGTPAAKDAYLERKLVACVSAAGARGGGRALPAPPIARGRSSARAVLALAAPCAPRVPAPDARRTPEAPQPRARPLASTVFGAAAAGAPAAWDGRAVDALVERLVADVRGVSTAKGEALRARALEHVRRGRALGALTADDWLCPGIGAKLALKVHEAALAFEFDGVAGASSSSAA